MNASEIASALGPELMQGFEQIFIVLAGFMLVFLSFGFIAGYMMAAVKYRNSN